MPYEYSRKGGKSVPVYLVSFIPAKPRFPPVRRALFNITRAKRLHGGVYVVGTIQLNIHTLNMGSRISMNGNAVWIAVATVPAFGRTAKNCQRLSCRPISVGLGVRNGARLDAHCPRSRGWRVLSRKKQNRKTKT